MVKELTEHDQDIQENRTPTQEQQHPDKTPTHIVGIGASAGGLEALERLFDNMPAETGMAFVVVQHLSPDFKSLMDELLGRRTEMRVHRVEDGMLVERDSIYLIAPKKDMINSYGKLLLTDKDPNQTISLPIDHFFRSLAQDAGANAIGVVLSGTGSDGSRGILDIHEAGGLVIVQDPETAKFDGMPKSAQESGIVDLILPPEQMGKALVKYINRSQADGEPITGEKLESPKDDGIDLVFRLLREEHNIDFSHYKPSTVSRRIERRLSITHIPSLEAYAATLRNNPSELNALYCDLLIGVTRFFRDEKAFERLQEVVLPELLDHAEKQGEFRVWVPGCATGEEPYSLAILIDELVRRDNRKLEVKIFATDVHRRSLEIAGAGVYSLDSLSQVSPERLERYFEKVTDGYQVTQDLRQMIVFAAHNLLKDAPFTKLDLISCRNLLIYFQPVAQKKALSLFHFGLRTGGALFLGPSESPGDLADEFDSLDEHFKIYRKRRDIRLPTDIRLPLPPVQTHDSSSRITRFMPSPGLHDASLGGIYDALLDQFMPPGLLINEQRQLIHSFGDAIKYLKLKPGRHVMDVLQMFEGDLRTAVTGAIQRVTHDQTPVILNGLRVRTSEGEQQINLTVQPIRSSGMSHGFFLICFENLTTSSMPPRPVKEIEMDEVSKERLVSLETELHYAKENLQATIEELETSNEELQAANEELVASNEELQSTNEELHSVNEELYTVNAEYQQKIAELTQLNTDIDHLLQNTEIGTIYLDRDFKIRKFTPAASEAFHVLPRDIGRPIEHISSNLEAPDLLRTISSVFETGQVYEEDVTNRRGTPFLMRVLPYRTPDGKINGVVLIFIDITVIKEAERELRLLNHLMESVVKAESMTGAFDLALKKVCESTGWVYAEAWAPSQRRDALELQPACYMADEKYEAFRTASAAIDFGLNDGLVGLVWKSLKPKWLRDLRDAHEEEFVRRELASTYGLKSAFAVPILDKDHVIAVLVFFMDKVSEEIRRHTELVGTVALNLGSVFRAKQAEEKVREAVQRRDQFLAMLSHELRNPLGAILNATYVLEQSPEEEDAKAAWNVVKRQAQQIKYLLDDLLDVPRITQGIVQITREVFDLRSTTEDVAAAVQNSVQRRGQQLAVSVPSEPVLVYGDRHRLQQIQTNLISNSVKYTPAGGRIDLIIEREDSKAVIRVRDNGDGIPSHLLEKVFELFFQCHETLDRSDGGMGVGLTLVRSLIELHDGTVTAHSDGPGKGSEFVVRLPLVVSAEQAVHRPSSLVNSGLHPLHVVLVEDNQDSRMMLQTLLQMRGCTVIAADNGKRGLQLIQEEKPDLALVDIGLPELDGYELARRLRKEKCTTFLVALTGYGQQKDRESVMEAGFQKHFVKPLKLEELDRLLVQLSMRSHE